LLHRLHAILASLLIALGSGRAYADAWTCTYPGFGPDRRAVTVTFDNDGDALVERPFGVPRFRIVRETGLAIIAENSRASRDTGGTYIDISTIIIDKRDGKYLLTVSQIGQAPTWSSGLCSHIE